jgi:hypothetical protein
MKISKENDGATTLIQMSTSCFFLDQCVLMLKNYIAKVDNVRELLIMCACICLNIHGLHHMYDDYTY